MHSVLTKALHAHFFLKLGSHTLSLSQEVPFVSFYEGLYHIIEF